MVKAASSIRSRSPTKSNVKRKISINKLYPRGLIVNAYDDDDDDDDVVANVVLIWSWADNNGTNRWPKKRQKRKEPMKR